MQVCENLMCRVRIVLRVDTAGLLINNVNLLFATVESAYIWTHLGECLQRAFNKNYMEVTLQNVVEVRVYNLAQSVALGAFR